MRIFIIILIVLLSACSPQKRLNRKYKKLQKFAQKHSLIITDSTKVVIRDTIVTETIHTDTVFSRETFYERLRDTVVINNDRLTIRQYYNNSVDSIFIEGECKGDSIPYEKEVYVPIEKPFVVEKEVHTPWWYLLLAGLLGIAFAMLVIKMYNVLTK